MSKESSTVLSTFNALPTDEQKEVIKAAVEADPALIPAGDDAKVSLWRALLVGSFVLGILALVGGVALTLFDHGDAAAPLYVISGAVVSGAFALFSKSPTG